jgi:hypothetical protein
MPRIGAMLAHPVPQHIGMDPEIASRLRHRDALFHY